MKDTYSAASLETAACLWEAVLEQRIRHPLINDTFERMGTSELRLTVLRWTELVDAAWQRAKDSYDRPFDWEFVPDWVARNIDWSGDQPIYKLERRA